MKLDGKYIIYRRMRLSDLVGRCRFKSHLSLGRSPESGGVRENWTAIFGRLSGGREVET